MDRSRRARVHVLEPRRDQARQGLPARLGSRPAAAGSNGDKLKPGRLPRLAEDYGIPADFNYEAALFEPGEQPLRPPDAMQWGPNWEEDQGAGEFPNGYFFYLPRLCNHCTKPACLAACPRQAISKREEDGIVLIDQERCRGYRYCVAACPYKKIYFNPLAGTSEKCIFCYPRVEKGVPQACAYQCVGRARHVSYLDDAEGAALPAGERVESGAAAARRIRHPAQRLLRAAAVAADFRRGRQTHRPATHPGRLPATVVRPRRSIRRSPPCSGKSTKKARGESSPLMDLLIAYRHGDMFRLSRPDGVAP